MEGDNRDVSAVILLEMKDVAMHRFVNGTKSLFTSGTCKIAKIQHSNKTTVYFINMNSFYYTLRKEIVFVKFVYDYSVSYLFPHFENGLSTISLPRDSPMLHNLEEILTNAAVLTDYNTAMEDPGIRNRIETHCPHILTEPVYNPDSIKEAIGTTGKLLNTAFTAIGGFVKLGVEKAGNYINTKLEPGQNQRVNPETKQKWENLKKGTNDFISMSLESYNKYLDPYVKPVLEKGKKEIDNVKQKIQSSQNQNVKYARELAQTSQKALGEAFDGFVKGSKEVGGEFSNQTKKIVQKKFGEDYVKTFIDGQENPADKQGYEQVPTEEKNSERNPLLTPKEEKIQYPTLDENKKEE